MHLDLVNLLLVLFAAWAAGRVSSRMGYPAVLGELLAGIVFGPAALGWVHGSEALDVLAQVGILLMMLYIGMEIDPREIGRASWSGLLAAVGGFVTPFALAYLVVIAFGGTILAALFVGIAAGVTSLATKSRILVDLDLMDTRIAHVLMAGALIADTLSLIAFATVLGAAHGEGGFTLASVGLVAGKAAVFFGVSAVLGLGVLPYVGRWLVRQGLANRTGGFTLVLLLAVGYAELAELAGLHGIVGAFVAGLFLRDSMLGRRLSAELRSVVHDASIGFLAPIFFVTAGFQVSFGALRDDLVLLTVLVAAATVGKIVGTALFYLPTGHGWREGITIGAGMNGRGAVEIIIAGIALEAGIIDARLFSILVFLAICTTATVPVFLRWGVSWLRQRGELARPTARRAGVLVVGAGRTARLLARVLGDDARLVAQDPRLVALAREEGLPVTVGDPLDVETLYRAGAASAQRLVAMTADPGLDALIARLGREELGVPEVYILPGQAAAHHLGASALFGREVTLEDWDRRLDTDDVELVELLAHELGASDVLPLAVHGDRGRAPFTPGHEAGEEDVLYGLRRTRRR